MARQSFRPASQMCLVSASDYCQQGTVSVKQHAHRVRMHMLMKMMHSCLPCGLTAQLQADLVSDCAEDHMYGVERTIQPVNTGTSAAFSLRSRISMAPMNR